MEIDEIGKSDFLYYIGKTNKMLVLFGGKTL